MQALHLADSINCINAVGKHHQHTIAQVFNHLAASRNTNLAQPVGQAGNHLGSFGIAKAFKNAGAPS